MLIQTTITDALPVLAPIASPEYTIGPADYVDIGYSAALLLPAHFDAALLAHPEYAVACSDGFECYFSEMYDDNEEGEEVFLPRLYSWEEVRAFVLRSGVPDTDRRFGDLDMVPYSYNVGFVLGWLSALALTDRALALRGLALLSHLVSHVQLNQFSLAPRSVGMDGWPLDL